MVERRSLKEGLKSLDENIDPDLAEQFIYDGKQRRSGRPSAPAPEASPPAANEPASLPPLPQAITTAAQVHAPSSPLTGVGRVPVGARVRTELAAALKRASLNRQLQGIQPNSVQDILEDALELWLHKHGLLG
jgi:hypothetical protein